MIKCASCGASVPESAEWCSLCFTPLGKGEVPSSAPEAAMQVEVLQEHAENLAHLETAATAVPGVVAEAVENTTGDWYVTGDLGDHQLISRGGERAWRCGVCGTSEWLDVVVCTVCGTSLFSSEEMREADLTADPKTALRWSLVPGGGLWYVGLKAQAVTLGALVGLCVGSAFIFPRSGLGLAGLAAFVLCAAALWAVGARDAREVALTGLPSSMFLRDRRLFWVALAVLGLLLATGVLGLVAGAMSRPPSVPSPR